MKPHKPVAIMKPYKPAAIMKPHKPAAKCCAQTPFGGEKRIET